MNRTMKSNQRRRHFLKGALGLGGMAMALGPGNAAAGDEGPAATPINVRVAGARGDGARLDTRALQSAIDRCAAGGGGTVWFPAGAYLSGTLFLRDRVTLHLEPGAVLLGSRDLADYPPTVARVRSYTDNYTERSLIYAEGVKEIGLEGGGTIDGQGAAFKGPYKVRPYLIRMVACEEVTVRGLRLRNSPMWVQHYLACDRLWLDGLRVESRCNANNDGIDIDGCQRVRIANCDISSGDDAIVLKSTLDRPCQQVVITNCVLSSACNAFKLGTESNGGFEDITLSNCAMHDTELAGIALELVDGGTLERVAISNVTMRNVNGPIFVRLGNRARPFQEGRARPGLGRLRHVSISHVQASGANGIGCSITGLPEAFVEGLTLSDIQIGLAGGGGEDQARRAIAERTADYPEYSMFGPLPACGFYCRHARDVRFTNVRLACERPDERPSFVAEDVEGLDLLECHAKAVPRANPQVRLIDVRDARLHGCVCPRGAPGFVRVEGARSERIRLLDNDLSGATRLVELGPGVSESAVSTRSG
jgi:hypothetical protein